MSGKGYFAIERRAGRRARRMGLYSGKGAVILGAVFAVMLSGCGHVRAPESVSETTLVVDQSGALTYYLVGGFEKEYYSLPELEDMARQEAEAFGGAGNGGESVVLETVELLPEMPDKVSVVYRFDGGESFEAFTGSSFFFGTVREALALGYDPGGGLVNVKDGSPRTKEQLEEVGEKRLIITDAGVRIYCPDSVFCVSGGVRLEEDGSVEGTGTEVPLWILFR